MARKPGRYLEGRLYMAWVAAALLLASWVGTAVHDAGRERQTQVTDGGQTTAVGSPARPQPQAHTRTRGS